MCGNWLAFEGYIDHISGSSKNVQGADKAIPTRPTPGLTALQLSENEGHETPAMKHDTIRGLPSSMKPPPDEDAQKSEDPFETEEPLVNFLE